MKCIQFYLPVSSEICLFLYFSFFLKKLQQELYSKIINNILNKNKKAKRSGRTLKQLVVIKQWTLGFFHRNFMNFKSQKQQGEDGDKGFDRRDASVKHKRVNRDMGIIESRNIGCIYYLPVLFGSNVKATTKDKLFFSNILPTDKQTLSTP